MHITKLAVIAVLVSACAAPAARDRPTTTATASASAGPEQREVCEVTRVTGTNVTRTVCRTEYESTLERNGAKEWMREGNSVSVDGQRSRPQGAGDYWKSGRISK